MELSNADRALRLDPRSYPRAIELELPNEVIEGFHSVAQ